MQKKNKWIFQKYLTVAIKVFSTFGNRVDLCGMKFTEHSAERFSFPQSQLLNEVIKEFLNVAIDFKLTVLFEEIKRIQQNALL